MSDVSKLDEYDAELHAAWRAALMDFIVSYREADDGPEVRDARRSILSHLDVMPASLTPEELRVGTALQLREITALRAEVERLKAQLTYLGGTVEVLSLSEQKLEAQLSTRDAEVRALRRFAKLMHKEATRSDMEDVNEPWILEVMIELGLLDEREKPTPLLTGEPGPGGDQ